MKKIIEVNGTNYLIEKDNSYWYARINDVLIIMPTIKEMKKEILKEANP